MLIIIREEKKKKQQEKVDNIIQPFLKSKCIQTNLSPPSLLPFLKAQNSTRLDQWSGTMIEHGMVAMEEKILCEDWTSKLESSLWKKKKKKWWKATSEINLLHPKQHGKGK